MIKTKFFCSFAFILLISISFVQNTDQIKKIKKNVVDMTDADIEKLYEEWEVRNVEFYFFNGGQNFKASSYFEKLHSKLFKSLYCDSLFREVKTKFKYLL